MSIQSLTYLLFTLVIWLIAGRVRETRHRLVLLVAASYFFYATWGVGFLAVLLVSSLLNYAWGRILRRHPTAGRLWVGIGLNLLILCVFKYAAAIVGILPANSPLDGFLKSIVMPVGISFWTFQAISYQFDVYREEGINPSLLEFCLYMVFWPTVLSGPVCRLRDMLAQFRRPYAPTWGDVAAGTHRILVGLFMKGVLAQILGAGLNSGEGVAAGFDRITQGWGGADVWFLAVGYGFQLFFDFAGYSHIVIGTARLFGIQLSENFARPYFSTTPSVFWTRWHMSLSFWIRDYVFLSLATMRRDIWWRNGVLIFAMTLFGLWHGATGPLVAWGLYQGVLLAGHRQIEQLRRRVNCPWPARLETAMSWGITFCLISLGWILFRSHDLNQAFIMLRALVTPHSYWRLVLPPNFYIVTLLVIGGYFVYGGITSALARWQRYARVADAIWLLSPVYYAAAMLLIVVWSKQESLFVYFQF